MRRYWRAFAARGQGSFHHSNRVVRFVDIGCFKMYYFGMTFC